MRPASSVARLLMAAGFAIAGPVVVWAQVGARGANPQLLAWSEALTAWQKEDGDSGALQLARGILFDCAAHRPAREIAFSPAFVDLAGNSFCRIGHQPQCVEQAEKAFEKATKMTPALVEARLRLGAARSERQPDQGRTDLVRVHDAPASPPELRYLAAIFLGKAAWARRDTAAAGEWFQKAVALNGNSVAARLLLSAASSNPSSESLFAVAPPESTDPWYSYRCRVFTQDIRDNLTARMQRSGGQ